MSAKKVEAKTRKVRVHETRTFVDEEPLVELVDEGEAPIEEIVNPIQSFLESIDNSRSLTMKVFLLPNFYKDGKRSIRANERPFVTQFPFSNEDIQDYQERIQRCCPAGGMFQLELREGFQIVRTWEEPISPAPGYQAGAHPEPRQSYPIIVNPAMQPAPPAQMNPADVMREHMSLAKDLVAMARDLQPQAPVAVEGASKSTEDKLLEAVLVKALESDKTPIDKVLEAMSGRRSEPGIMETLMPVIGEVIKAFAPSINAVIQRQAQVVAQQQQPTNGLTQPAQLGPAVEAPLVEGEQPPPPVAIDPVQRDYFQTIIRMLEDCTRHVELASVGGGSKSVLPSAEAVLELAERYPEQLGGTINILLMALPIEVLDSCAMLLDERGQQHIATILRPNAAALAWVKELQDECKRILKDSSDSESEVTIDEDKRTD